MFDKILYIYFFSSSYSHVYPRDLACAAIIYLCPTFLVQAFFAVDLQ
jgi:hypothetical protein